MPFVLDASISASWALADEASAIAELADSRLDSDVALVPRIWWYETRNLLIVNERRQRITAAHSARFLESLSGYPITIDSNDDEDAIFDLARRHQLTFYDATYLALAMRKGLPLATLDKALREAARAAGIPLLA
jgi:predicted nucleic acid-binding protein